MRPRDSGVLLYMADKVKLAIAFLLVVAGIGGFYYLSDNAMVLRVASVLVGIGLAVTVAWFTESGKRFYGFSQESLNEARKVVWPTRKETMQTTGVVFLLVVTMALFLWVVDASLMWMVKLLMGRGD
jgi:preprotein translocase subunit SecE